jgi:hypothetical protein
LKVGPVIPGAAAYAVAVTNKARAMVRRVAIRVMVIAFFMLVALIAALLVNVDFGHQAAEVLRIVG